MPETLQGAFQTTFHVERHRFYDTGLAALRTSGDGTDAEDKVAIVRVSDPFECVVVVWAATRWGAPPIAPHPLELVSDGNHVFLGQEIGAVIPVPVAGSVGHWFSWAGAYVYAIKKPVGAVADFPLGSTPLEPGTPLTDKIPKESFQMGLLGFPQAKSISNKYVS